MKYMSHDIVITNTPLAPFSVYIIMTMYSNVKFIKNKEMPFEQLYTYR